MRTWAIYSVAGALLLGLVYYVVAPFQEKPSPQLAAMPQPADRGSLDERRERATEAGVETARVEVASPVEPQPPAEVAAPPIPAEPKVRFDVEAVICEQIDRNVAEEMAVVAGKVWQVHQLTQSDPNVPKSSLLMDRILFAIWPNLAELAQQGQVEVVAHPNQRFRTEIGNGTASYAYSRTSGALSIAFHLPSYSVGVKVQRGTASRNCSTNSPRR
jgi:hypothetical protein